VSKFYNNIFSSHEIAEILLKLALNINQSINQLEIVCGKEPNSKIEGNTKENFRFISS